EGTGIPFRILLRAPFALVDAGTAFLLLLLLGDCRWRFVAAAAYWLNPLSIIFSAYHGNTDSAVAFFLVLCVWLLSKKKLLGAASAFIFNHRCTTKLAGRFSCSDFVFSREQLADRACVDTADNVAAPQQPGGV